MSRRIRVIGAHSADFVWRAAGAIAKAVELGGTAEVVALSYGECGESGELWKDSDPAGAHQPELCNFMPTTFVDITSVFEKKRAAMAPMQAQAYLQSYYAERAGHRGNHARRASGDQEVRVAEAFQRVIPQVVAEL